MSKRRDDLQAARSLPLVPLPVAVDLIRFEKNLLQIGFFGAHDTRHLTQSTRRIEQLVTRDGQRIKVAAEFRGSQELGLPSTSDRDKYIAFMKIAMEQKLKLGRIQNPIRFTGYRLLKELGLTFSGENYEDINRWGQRMADTTITSEQVIYMAAKKKYANKTVHVFRSFQRTGHSEQDGSGKVEAYEVMLEDWLLENLNQSFVVPEDFNAYRSLRRPTAKGIFGYLHLWFHASNGRPVEKDYAELCMLLNIPVYRHASKIRETMGRSLDELASIGYLAEWDIRPMTSKDGYKLVLIAGEQVADVLALSLRRQLEREATTEEIQFDDEKLQAVRALQQRGVSSAKAKMLVMQFSLQVIYDQIEYAEYLLARDRRRKLDNPAGFIIYAIEKGLQIPDDHTASKHPRKNDVHCMNTIQSLQAQNDYKDFLDREIDREINERFTAAELSDYIKKIIKKHSDTDRWMTRMSPIQQEAYAMQLLRSELKACLPLPSFESWCKLARQLNLLE